MNKMNLPAPFGQVTPTPPVVSQPMKKSMRTIERLKFTRVVEGTLGYCSIELFFKWYFGNFNFNLQYCSILLADGIW